MIIFINALNTQYLQRMTHENFTKAYLPNLEFPDWMI